MYNPLIKTFDYTLDHLSKLDVPDLPDFQEDHQLVLSKIILGYVMLSYQT